MAVSDRTAANRINFNKGLFKMRILIGAILLLASGYGAAQVGVDYGQFASSGPIVEGTVCNNPDYVSSDDGTAENGYSGNPAVVTEATVVDRFSAADFPGGAIDSVCVGWVSLGPTSVNFEIVVFDDDGAGGAPGTELGSLSASATGLPTGLPATLAEFNFVGAGVALPGTGDFYLGIRYAPSSPNVFVAADETGATNAGAGQLFFDTGDPMTDDWQAVNGLFPNYSAMLIRGLPGTGLPESQPVPALGWQGILLMTLLLAGLAALVFRSR